MLPVRLSSTLNIRAKKILTIELETRSVCKQKETKLQNKIDKSIFILANGFIICHILDNNYDIHNSQDTFIYNLGYNKKKINYLFLELEEDFFCNWDFLEMEVVNLI